MPLKVSVASCSFLFSFFLSRLFCIWHIYLWFYAIYWVCGCAWAWAGLCCAGLHGREWACAGGHVRVFLSISPFLYLAYLLMILCNLLSVWVCMGTHGCGRACTCVCGMCGHVWTCTSVWERARVFLGVRGYEQACEGMRVCMCGLCAGLCGCAHWCVRVCKGLQVCKGMCGHALIYAGVHRCARVCMCSVVSRHARVCNNYEFSKYLLEIT